jgi:predicted nuclease of predicted toxin-antitoxin system
VRFVVDAQLPRRIAYRLREAGHDAIHTLDLPRGNETTDAEICELSSRDARVVVTKDADFVDSLVLHALPWKLLLISTGNASNRELETLLLRWLPDLVLHLEGDGGLHSHSLVELGWSGISGRY